MPGAPAPRPGVGTGHRHRHDAPISRTLRRLAVFGVARFVDEGTYAVRRRIPPATGSQLRRISPELVRVHTALLARHDAARLAAPPSPPVRHTA